MPRNSRKLNCFVAFAFGRADTLALYKQSIKPTLVSLGIKPRCLITIEHNDDINNRIITEIKKADFAIADLTYARPSVYYEAGFAERVMPVIYLSKRETLDRPTLENRIHFDLQMKNIIIWTSPQSEVFKRGLRKRINHVVRPIVAEIERQVADEKETAMFRARSAGNRLSILEEISLGLAKRKGFSQIRRSSRISWCLWRAQGKRISFLNIVLSPKLTKSQMRSFLQDHARFTYLYYGDYLKKNRPRIAPKASEQFLFCSLDRYSFESFRHEFPAYDWNQATDELRQTGYQDIMLVQKRDQRSTVAIGFEARVRLISGVKHERDFTERVTRAIS